MQLELCLDGLANWGTEIQLLEFAEELRINDSIERQAADDELQLSLCDPIIWMAQSRVESQWNGIRSWPVVPMNKLKRIQVRADTKIDTP